MNSDLISRKDLRKEVTEKVHFMTVDGHIAYDKMLKLIDSAPTVEPQKKGLLSIDDVMSVFDEFMCNEVDDDGTEIFLGMLKDKAKEMRNEQ